MIGCPTCGADSNVTETRETPGGARRRRICSSASCRQKFTTYEFVLAPSTTDPKHAKLRGEMALVPVHALHKVKTLIDKMSVAAAVPKVWADVWSAELGETSE